MDARATNTDALVTITGTVASTTGETLPGAHVYYRNGAGQVVDGVATDSAGRYVVQAPVGAELSASFVGYEPKTVLISGRDAVVNFALVPGVELPEVEITPERSYTWLWVILGAVGARALFK